MTASSSGHRPVGWAFIGAGRHARLWLAPALVGASGARAVGVWSRDAELAATYAEVATAVVESQRGGGTPVHVDHVQP